MTKGNKQHYAVLFRSYVKPYFVILNGETPYRITDY